MQVAAKQWHCNAFLNDNASGEGGLASSASQCTSNADRDTGATTKETAYDSISRVAILQIFVFF